VVPLFHSDVNAKNGYPSASMIPLTVSKMSKVPFRRQFGWFKVLIHVDRTNAAPN